MTSFASSADLGEKEQTPQERLRRLREHTDKPHSIPGSVALPRSACAGRVRVRCRGHQNPTTQASVGRRRRTAASP